MEKSVTEGIFPGMAGLFSPVGTEQVQRLQAAGQPTNPLQAVSGNIGFLGERMQQGIGSAFGQMPQIDRKRQIFQQLVQQLQQQGVDLSSSEGLIQLAQKMGSIPGFEGEALGLRQRAAQMAQQQRMTGLEEQRLMAQTGLAQAQTQKAMRPEEAMVKTPANFAAVGSSLGIPPKANLAEYTQDESARINAQIQQNKERESAAGVAPQPGQLPLEDVVRARNIVEGETKDSKERLSTVGRLRALLSEAQGGSGTAVAQMRRELVKLVGDSQIGQGEVRDALGSLGIVGDVLSGINQVFTGTPSKEKLADVQRVINALENSVAKSYNSSVDRTRILLEQGRLSPEIVQNVVPQKYTPASAKKKSKFIEGKIYKDANGNRAVYRNGKFEPIQ
jgi:hypothetical protein